MSARESERETKQMASTEEIRSSLAEAGGMRRYLDTLRKQSYVSIRGEAVDLTPLPAAPPR